MRRGAERLAAGRPRHFPSVFAWLSVGLWRNWRGVLGVLLSTWLNVPFATVVAVLAVLLGVVGFFAGSLSASLGAPGVLTGVPVLGPLLDSVTSPGSSGVLTGVTFIVLGVPLGFVAGLWLFWAFVSGGDPLAGVVWLLGGVVVGLLYTVYRMVFESWILRVSGARRMSRREQALLLPIVQDCTRRLGLPNHPPILMDDSRQPNANAYTRHIVINQGLLEEFQYDRAVIAGVLCHELVHWRNGDPISAAFIRGIALPLYLTYAGAGWLIQKLDNHPLISLLVWAFLWPVLVTVKYVIMPLQAADTRRAEFRADQGAVLAGHQDGLRRVIARLRRSFESGRNGWDQAVCATHPPNELRLERLEDSARQYPLPDPDGAAA